MRRRSLAELSGAKPTRNKTWAIDPRMKKVEAKLASKDFGAEGLPTSRRADEEQPALGREPVPREVTLRAELGHDSFESPPDLGGEHDLGARALWVVDLDERRVPIGVAR